MNAQEQQAFDAMREALEDCLFMSDGSVDVDVLAALSAAKAVSADQAITAMIETSQELGLYDEAKAVQPQDFSDKATIAGLEASIGHLSSLVNEQLLLLEEVNDNLGVDGIGVELDDDQSPTIAKVRAHLAAMAPPVQPQAQEDAPVAYIAWKDGKPCYEGDDAICEDAVWPVDSDDDRASVAREALSAAKAVSDKPKLGVAVGELASPEYDQLRAKVQPTKLQVTLVDSPVDLELAQYKRMFEAACVDLGLINEALGLDPNDGGSEPILDAIAELKSAHPQASEPSKDAKTWCEYVAGMIGGYLNEPVDSDKCKAIAGIIERRLWALPAAPEATK